MKTGILAGAFNPVTRAHVALAQAARTVVDEVISVIPRTYPHKQFHGATLDQRVEMILRTGAFDRVEITQGGLFIDIARELRAGEMFFICGRDAAERVLKWDYDDPSTLKEMFCELRLLVAERDGQFEPPPHLADAVLPLKIEKPLDEISSSDVRRRIASSEPWEHLVPDPILEIVRNIYSR